MLVTVLVKQMQARAKEVHTDGGNKTNTKTSNDSPNNHQSQTRRGSLTNATHAENATSSNDGPSSANTVGDITCNDGSEKGSARQDSGQEGLLPARKNKCSYGSSVVWIWVGKTGVLADVVFHSHDAGNCEYIANCAMVEDSLPSHPSSVVSEKYSSKSSKCTHEVGLGSRN